MSITEKKVKVTQIFKTSTEYWQIYFLAKHTIIFSQEADLRIYCADLENLCFSLSSRCKLFEVILMGIQLKKRERKEKEIRERTEYSSDTNQSSEGNKL